MTVGVVVQLWRYPVRSMLGEQVDATPVGARGPLGDRAYAVVDTDGRVVPTSERGFRATYTAEPDPGAVLPPADVLFPDGSTLRTDDERIHTALSELLGRDVRVVAETDDDGAPLRLTTTPDPDHRVHVVLDAGEPDGPGHDWTGRTVRLGDAVLVTITAPSTGAGLSGADLSGDCATPGEVRVGDVVTLA